MRTSTPVRFLCGLCLSLAVDTGSAAAQSYPISAPSRLTITRETSGVFSGQGIDFRVTLVNRREQPTAATADLPISLVITTWDSLEVAHRDLMQQDRQGTALAQTGQLTLPAGRTAARASAVLTRGQTVLNLKAVSYRTGAIRIFAESPGLVSGSTVLIVMNARTRRRPSQVGFMPAVWRQPLPDGLALTLEADDTGQPPLVNGQWQRKFLVVLRSGQDYVEAPANIVVRFRIVSGTGSWEPHEVTIAQGTAESTVLAVLSTASGGSVSVAAGPVQPTAVAIAPAETTVTFPLSRMATRLVLDAIPESALANGLDPIEVRVKAVDAANNPISAQDEGLAKRDVLFRFDGRTRGLRFEKGLTAIQIPADRAFASVRLFGSTPVVNFRVVAEAVNKDGKTIQGERVISLYFPWVPLIFSALGSTLVVAVRGGNWKLLIAAAISGAVLFGLVFFGALVASQANWEGLAVELTRLPTENAFAAAIIGALAGGLVDVSVMWKGRPAKGPRMTTSGPAS